MSKPLQRGIFVSGDSKNKVWVPFKYENLLIFCFDCGRMGHGIKACGDTVSKPKGFSDADFPYSNALKAKSNLLGRENFRIKASLKKSMNQCAYTGEEGDEVLSSNGHCLNIGELVAREANFALDDSPNVGEFKLKSISFTIKPKMSFHLLVMWILRG